MFLNYGVQLNLHYFHSRIHKCNKAAVPKQRNHILIPLEYSLLKRVEMHYNAQSLSAYKCDFTFYSLKLTIFIVYSGRQTHAPRRLVLYTPCPLRKQALSFAGVWSLLWVWILLINVNWKSEERVPVYRDAMGAHHKTVLVPAGLLKWDVWSLKSNIILLPSSLE